MTAIEKRLEAIEAQLASARNPQLVNVWTPSLARRIEAALPPGHGLTLINLTFSDPAVEEAFEASLWEDNPKEAEKLNRLLNGQLPEH